MEEIRMLGIVENKKYVNEAMKKRNRKKEIYIITRLQQKKDYELKIANG